jgi:hypothetical protein
VKRDDNKTDGIILLAEAYPHDEEQMALTLQYAESAEDALNHQFKFKRFLMQKTTAHLLWEGLSGILLAPDTESAWEHIANNCPEADCHFDEDDSAPEAN